MYTCYQNRNHTVTEWYWVRNTCTYYINNHALSFSLTVRDLWNWSDLVVLDTWYIEIIITIIDNIHVHIYFDIQIKIGCNVITVQKYKFHKKIIVFKKLKLLYSEELTCSGYICYFYRNENAANRQWIILLCFFVSY